jgi:16S rRNA (guanine(1405)-N(7))-methyltransferase
VSDPFDVVVGELRAARKYRHLSDETLARIARWALERHRSERDATKAAKRKLHQVFAAYCTGADVETLQQRVAALPELCEEGAFRKECREILRGHASTAERLPVMEQLYPALWDAVGQPRSVLDLACGYHPFSLPWMGLEGPATYFACDIDQRLIAAVNSFLKKLGRSETAWCKDILTGLPQVTADVILLLKSLPCLEQQERQAGPKLLRGITARYVIVSFPLETLGGRDKGMRAGYDRRMTEIVGEVRRPVQRLEMGNEVFYVLAAGSAPR